MGHIGTKGVGLRQRITDLQNELALFVTETNALSDMTPHQVLDHLERTDRRVATIRLGIHVIRYESRMLVRAEKRLAAATGGRA